MLARDLRHEKRASTLHASVEQEMHSLPDFLVDHAIQRAELFPRPNWVCVVGVIQCTLPGAA